MPRVTLRDDEVRSIQELLAEVTSRYDTAEDPGFHADAELYAHRLPRRLRRELLHFRRHEPRSAVLVISGYPIDEAKIGPTPEHWKRQEERRRTFEEEVLLVLFGSLLGECIGWSTQQDGRLVHDILPIEADREAQLGSGSETELTWHTEDAFHPHRGDYLGMACLRNPDGVPTTFAHLEGLEMPEEQIRLLFQPTFTIKPDNSHRKENNSEERAADAGIGSSYGRIERMNREPDKIAVLFGDPRAPYLRLDPYFMDPVADPEAQAALDALIGEIDRRLHDLVLHPGDFCFIDNYQGVHGRKPFKARFDGTDRWMKRVNVTRDLRRSRGFRGAADDRVIH